ncbi:MAG: phosphoenolpyruvate carboxykinase (ATP) [Chloroflexota bacterium]|nr:phosphoenolpyruvate carboxykinase (ATP) [Chloroflexota bacterium]
MSTLLEQFAQTTSRIREKALKEHRLVSNPSNEELRALVEKEPGIRKTRYGNFVADSEPTSRAAMFTRNSVDHVFGEEEHELLKQCEQALAKDRLISVDTIVGDKASKVTARFVIPERFAHVAYGGRNLYLPLKQEVEQPTYEILMFFDEAFESNKSKALPCKDITIRLAMLDDGRIIKIIRNSNYIGEYKKGVFAAEDWTSKTYRGGIFLHAGCREDYLQSVHGDYRWFKSLLIALTANGKTSTTSKILARKGNEQSWLIQDDGGTLMPDGSFRGFEGGGIFVKTESVNPGNQMEIFYGLLKAETLCENVAVTEQGELDFYNFDKTSNGRAVILRKDFLHASSDIDVDKIDNMILITRGSSIPAISKLTPEQATALMVIGQSMESSAGDPTQAGKIRREFFYDPFMAGGKAEHANKFYTILKNLPYNINCFLINTGGIGEGEHYHDIKLEDTLAILDSLLRGGLEDWVDSPTGFKVPRAIRYVDDIYLHPERLYSKAEFAEKQKKLSQIRREAIEKVGDSLNSNVRNVFR